MEKYNYLEAMKERVKSYLEDNEWCIDLDDFETFEDFEESLYETLFTQDYVTGNASGSYTFNRWEAEENLCHNMDLLKEALENFGCGIEYLEKGAEACDVTIRCYLLGQAISEALEELGGEDAFYEAKEESEEE